MSKIFYIPGLGGEGTVTAQRNYITRLNRLFKKEIFLFDPLWETKESAEAKLSRLKGDYEKAGRPSTIFGVSAGASAALILASEVNKEARIITVAGKHKGSEGIGSAYQERAPGLLGFVTKSENLLQRDTTLAARLNSYHAFLVDGIVPMKDVIIAGARNRLILMPFHTPAIIAGLLFVLPFTR